MFRHHDGRLSPNMLCIYEIKNIKRYFIVSMCDGLSYEESEDKENAVLSN
jgi:hypothetical protein